MSTGTKIAVYISLGPDEAWTSIPNLVGLTVDQARHLLEINNLRVGDITEEAAEEPAGTIIAQDPDSGGVQVEGTAINIIVSTGAGGEFKRIAIPVELPVDVDRLVTFQAYQDGELVQEESLNPSEVGTWRPWFTRETEEVFIEVFMDGKSYKQYELNFDTRLFQEVAGGAGLPGGSDNRQLERPRDNH